MLRETRLGACEFLSFRLQALMNRWSKSVKREDRA